MEGSDAATAVNLREKIEFAFLHQCQTSLDHFLRNFTVVTDSVAVMAKVASAFVSTNSHIPDETWLGCLTHFFNNPMKHTIASCMRESTLQVLVADFKAMKRILKDADRTGWNQYLQMVTRLFRMSKHVLAPILGVHGAFLKL